jgi:VWFA-related protein
LPAGTKNCCRLPAVGGSLFRRSILFKSLIWAFLLIAAISVEAQNNYKRELNVTKGANIEIVNNFGRVDVLAEKPETEEPTEIKSFLTASSLKSVAESEIKISNSNNKVLVEIVPSDRQKRIDISLHLPERTNLKIETAAGEVRVSGDFAEVEVRTETGTIAADVPLENLSYNFLWTASRPRFLSDVELDEVREKSAGKFVVSGKVTKETPKSKFSIEKLSDTEEDQETSEAAEAATTPETSETSEGDPATTGKNDKKDKKKKDKKASRDGRSELKFSTARGIVLLNVNPNEVPSDLRERPLTNAAKAIIRSGDSLLMEAIRRASPKYFGEYAETLPPAKFEPSLNVKTPNQTFVNSNVKKVLVRVTDLNNRAVADLKKEDFQVLERGTERDILSVEPTTAPFNLVLLLDVSGSVENYVDFIRKAARAFVETADRRDRIAIIIFNEDVKQISTFTTDKGKLSESLDTFDAGGGTAYYDSLAYTLADTLRPLRGERTAIVVLTDGDDNYSFLPFEALLGSLQESGALVYPLYVPSALVAASNADLNARIDPLRAKYMGLTTKAEGEGERLAQVSGGVYYPITQLNQIQKAYDDIVLQLRTAYSVTFKSDLVETSDKLIASPRLKVKVKRENAFVKLGSVVEVKTGVSEVKK